MLENKNVEFTCRECGAHELGYQKYVKCVTPAFLNVKENGHIEYGQSVIDEDDYLDTLKAFACRSCGRLIEHCDYRMETERELLNYFAMDPIVREKEEMEYKAFMSTPINVQDLKNKEQNDFEEEISCTD